jgi:hypothetical protein
MINPIRLVKDIFDDLSLSDIRLQPYTNDHLIRLGNNNPGGIYSQLITDTTLAYTGFYGKLTEQDTKEAISEGLTITSTNAKAAVLVLLSTQRDLVAYKFGAQSTIYQEFFPQGVDEYHQARMDVLPRLLERYVGAATTHLTADFPAEVTQISGLTTAYTNARNAQLGIFSETDAVRTGRRETRKVLTLQLTKNLLTLAIDFLDNPDRFDDYYNAEMLPITASSSGDSGEQPPAGTATSLGGTVVDEVTLAPQSGVVMKLSNAQGSTSAITDADGKYQFEELFLTATASGTLAAIVGGNIFQSRPITLEPGGNYTENFQLGPATPLP